MKILLVGARGTIGKVLYNEFSKKAEVVSASRNDTDVTVDITSPESIEQMYESVKEIDSVICAAGPAKFGAFAELSEEDFYIGIRGKLMGQINLVRIGQKYLNDGGSFTLTTGVLADDPVAGSTSLALVNGAVNSFAVAAALEMLRGLRINVIAPTVVADAAEKYADVFPGYDPVSMDRVVNGYVRSVYGKTNGRIFRIN
jgi:NADP-dependent 3-hydroxy acid dehydrogenase YdfG